MTSHGKTAAVGILTLAMALGWGGAELIGQQAAGASAEAHGASVNTALVSATSPLARLDGGEYAGDAAPSVDLGGLVRAENAFARTTGSRIADNPTAESVSTLESVDVLDGVVTADLIVAIATSAIHPASTGSDAEGSTFRNLNVAGTAIPADVAPNTRIDVPGVGTVIVNEQTPSGDGVGSTGLTVNMVRVILKDALTGETTGEITVGSAATSVTSG